MTGTTYARTGTRYGGGERGADLKGEKVLSGTKLITRTVRMKCMGTTGSIMRLWVMNTLARAKPSQGR